MYGDEFTSLLQLDSGFFYTPKDKWIGLRNIQTPNEKEEGWNNRKGLRQQYQLNFLPCLAFVFHITRWTPIKKEKKK